MTSTKDKSAEPSHVVTQYETLRSAALGDALSPEARTGLMLFLRRGMWAWARALTTLFAFEQSTGSQPSSEKMPESARPVIHILAAMAIQSTT